MVTMIDEIFDRHYQTGRTELNATILAGLGRFSRSVLTAFTVLQRIEYDAPWTARSKRARTH